MTKTPQNMTRKNTIFPFLRGPLEVKDAQKLKACQLLAQLMQTRKVALTAPT